MAGHSQFKNIMHKKGRQDAIRPSCSRKLAREITVAAKRGAARPGVNPRLRAAIQAAEPRTCPRTTSSGRSRRRPGGDGENYEEVRYEGYGPGGVAVIVEALTDNRNRTAGEVRSTFAKHGGALAETGAVSASMFDRVGLDRIRPQGGGRRHDARGRDRGRRRRRRERRGGARGRSPRTSSARCAKALEARFGEPEQAAMGWRPQATVAVDDERAEGLLN